MFVVAILISVEAFLNSHINFPEKVVIDVIECLEDPAHDVEQAKATKQEGPADVVSECFTFWPSISPEKLRLEFWVLGDSLLAQVGHLQYCSI
jgi:hypothetical protein